MAPLPLFDVPMDGGPVKPVEGAALEGARFRYFDYVMAAFVTILLLSNHMEALPQTFFGVVGRTR